MSSPTPTVASHADAHQQFTSPLFSLPFEIRSRIYAYYLSFTPSDFTIGETVRPTHMYLDPVDGNNKPRDGDVGYTRPLPSLMLTCRRAYGELAPLAHGLAAVRIRPGGAYEERRIGVAFHGILKFEQLRRLIVVVEMGHASWNLWVPFIVGLVGRTPGLEHLVVDWAPWDSEIEATKVGWRRRLYEKKEGEFLELVEGLRELRTVTLHGRVPRDWKGRIEKATGTRVVVVPERWWSDAWDE